MSTTITLPDDVVRKLEARASVRKVSLDDLIAKPLVTPAHPLRKRVLNSLQAGDTFSIAVPALTELLFGISILPQARQNLEEWEHLKPSFNSTKSLGSLRPRMAVSLLASIYSTLSTMTVPTLMCSPY